MSDEVLIVDQNKVRMITINRPIVKNALNTTTRIALKNAIESADKNIKVIFIRGAGGDFCAGQDLSDFANMDPSKPIDGEKILKEEYEPILFEIEKSNVPVIALVEGACVGAGFSLALACDFIIAHEDAHFQLAFAKIGLVPDVGASYFLPRKIGQANALAMALTAERIEANRALLMGMVWQVWSHEIFESKVLECAEFFANSAPFAMAATRKLMRISLDNNLKDQLDLEAKNQAQALRSQDFYEGVFAFFEKRKPEFRGE